LAYLAGSLLKEGYQVEIYNQDVNHWPDSHLTQFLDDNQFDVVGIGMAGGYYQYRKLLSLSKAINTTKYKPLFILGGHLVSPDPKYFLKKTGADVIVLGEGEETIIEVLDSIYSHKSFSEIQGIAFNTESCQGWPEVQINERRPLIQNLDNIPFPAYHLFPMELYRLVRYPHTNTNEFSMSMLSGRGCPYHCTFCYRLDPGFRPRSSASIIEEMKYLKDAWGITNIYFFDELLMSSKERSISLSNDIKEANLGMKWSCNGRLNLATPEVLKIMKESGCVFINYGIEAMDNEVLKLMKKNLTTDIIIKGIENTLAAGISNGLNVMWGNRGDNLETLDKAVKFLLKYDDGIQVRTIHFVIPFPGCELFNYAVEKGYIKDVEDFYENKYLNSDLLTVNFMNISDEEAYKAICEANKILLKNYYDNLYNNIARTTENFYKTKDITFRGYRHS